MRLFFFRAKCQSFSAEICRHESPPIAEAIVYRKQTAARKPPFHSLASRLRLTRRRLHTKGLFAYGIDVPRCPLMRAESAALMLAFAFTSERKLVASTV
jgi:hypothetical protein